MHRLQPPLNRGAAWRVYTGHTAFVSCCPTGDRSRRGRGPARGQRCEPRAQTGRKASAGTLVRDLGPGQPSESHVVTREVGAGGFSCSPAPSESSCWAEGSQEGNPRPPRAV